MKRVWCTTRDGRRRCTAYSDTRRALVITRSYKPLAPSVDRYAITHRRTGLLVCGETLFADLPTARKALRALLPLGWDYDEPQTEPRTKDAMRTLERIKRVLAALRRDT